jgi:hypothetical protein
MSGRSTVPAFISALAIALLCTSAGPILACSCVPLTAKEAAARTPVLFEGEVISRRRQDNDFGPGELTTLRVVRPLKGVTAPTIEIQTNVDSAACGVTFEGDLKGVVIGAYPGENGALTTTWCTMKSLNQERQ